MEERPEGPKESVSAGRHARRIGVEEVYAA